MSPAQHSRRPGFTLVELLIVVALIAVLLALSASATMRVIDVQRGSNTEQTVKIVSEMLDRHWQMVAAQALGDEVIPSNVESTLLQLAGNDRRRMRLLFAKLKLQQQFPMTFTEALSPVLLQPVPAYQRALQGATAGPKTSQSSVCLLLALQQTRGGMTLEVDRLGSAAITDGGVQGSTDAQSLKQIVDGFANGIAFFRWPVFNEELNPSLLGHAGFKDPLDPEGHLSNLAWLKMTNPVDAYLWFEKYVHPLPQPRLQAGGRSFNVRPVVASAGRNGQWGFGPTADDFTRMRVNDPEQANDNIYSHRLRFGARGD